MILIMLVACLLRIYEKLILSAFLGFIMLFWYDLSMIFLTIFNANGVFNLDGMDECKEFFFLFLFNIINIAVNSIHFLH